MDLITESLLNKLVKASMLSQFPTEYKHNIDIYLSEKEQAALVSYASILSLGEGHEVNRAYEIITRLLEYTKGTSNLIKLSADVIFSRIGNFPSRNLLRTRYSISNFISAPLKLEMLARETENTVDIDSEDIKLTNFQLQLYNAMGEERNLSISAPTSAGKSFVLNLSLGEQIKRSENSSIVYVVPTRALISEVSNRIRTAIKKVGSDKAVLRTAPFPVDRNVVKSNVVYVFTQERLLSFLGSKDGEPKIDTLIIDEAHEIQKGKRGIILQTAVDLSLKRFSGLKLMFASPLIKNPEFLLSLFNRADNGRYFTEIVSPVAQNVILVSNVDRKTKYFKASVLTESGVSEIGEFEAPFKFRGSISEQIGNFALSLANSSGAVISFSNKPKDAEDRAVAASRLSPCYSVSKRLETFIKFVKSDIHESYSLISCLEKGIAFHYGNMPSLLRNGVEELFKSGDLRLIFCTSTLLQGVNLPAKNIIVENPKSGDEPMSRADFLNLAGRAGRLMQEFHGNVWCIRPSEWDSDCYQGEKLQQLSSYFSSLLMDGGVRLVESMNSSSIDEKQKDSADVAIGKLYNDYLNSQEFGFIESFRTDSNSQNIDETINMLKSIETSLPSEIISNNQVLRPDYLESLYLYLKGQDFLEDFYPVSPYIFGSKARFDKILDVILEHFKWGVHEKYKPLLSMLTYQWVWGKPIGNIIRDRISYLRDRYDNTDVDVSSVVRNLLKSLETDVRFKLVKYFSAYVEILRFVASEKGLSSADRIESYHIYLEFGSCKKTVLNLMSIGLSRFTALHLDTRIKFDDSAEPESYLKTLRSMNLNALKIPQLCIEEALSFIQ